MLVAAVFAPTLVAFVPLATALNPQATLRVGKNPTFVRVQFDWSVDTVAEFHQDGAAASNSDAEMAGKIDAARVETDVAKRKALYDEVQRKGHDLNYTVPLFNLQDIYGMSERMDWKPRVDAKLMVSEMKVVE